MVVDLNSSTPALVVTLTMGGLLGVVAVAEEDKVFIAISQEDRHSSRAATSVVRALLHLANEFSICF